MKLTFHSFTLSVYTACYKDIYYIYNIIVILIQSEITAFSSVFLNGDLKNLTPRGPRPAAAAVTQSIQYIITVCIL